jgi:hypothetical protein
MLTSFFLPPDPSFVTYPPPTGAAAATAYAHLLSWFLDAPAALRMALAGKAAGKDVGMWFGPIAAAGAIRWVSLFAIFCISSLLYILPYFFLHTFLGRGFSTDMDYFLGRGVFFFIENIYSHWITKNEDHLNNNGCTRLVGISWHGYSSG